MFEFFCSKDLYIRTYPNSKSAFKPQNHYSPYTPLSSHSSTLLQRDLIPTFSPFLRWMWDTSAHTPLLFPLTTFHSPRSHSHYQTYWNSFQISLLLNFYQSNLEIKIENKTKTNKICLKLILRSRRVK